MNDVHHHYSPGVDDVMVMDVGVCVAPAVVAAAAPPPPSFVLLVYNYYSNYAWNCAWNNRRRPHSPKGFVVLVVFGVGGYGGGGSVIVPFPYSTLVIVGIGDALPREERSRVFFHPPRRY